LNAQNGNGRGSIFFFHVCDAHQFDQADEGIDLPNVEAARNEAIRSLRDLVAGDVCRGEANLGMFVEVEDETGQLLLTVSLEEPCR
jgi:hypothetical protein